MVTVRLIDMPVRIKGFTRPNPDGSYTMLLNSRHSRSTLANTYRHEMEHVDSGDFEQVSVDLIERMAHGGEG